MRTSAAGNKPPVPASAGTSRSTRGFTLVELLVVVAIIAIASAGVSFALRDSQGAQLEREGERLAALLESARAQSRATGVPVRWQATDGGFRFDGLPQGTFPDQWLSPATHVQGNGTLVLGPDPIIGRQEIVIAESNAPDRQLRITTDGLRPFHVTVADTGT